MAKMIFPLFLMCLLGCCFADYVYDNYFDQCMNSKFQEEITYAKLDPASLGDFTVQFRHKASFITSKVKCSYHDGVLKGIRYIRRLMSSIGPSYENGKVTYNVTLVFDKLIIDYKMDGKYGKVPTVHNNDCNVKLPPLNVMMKIRKDPNTNAVSIDSLKADSLRDCNSEYSGLGSVLNKVLSIVKEQDKDPINAQIQSFFTVSFRIALARALDKCPYPQSNSQPQFPQNQVWQSNPSQSAQYPNQNQAGINYPQNQNQAGNQQYPQYPQYPGQWQNLPQSQNPYYQVPAGSNLPQYHQGQTWN